ncbi:thiamine diphosphokinase [Alkalihalobacillus sp. AL-G]|uniref:thiamine diphosphokinase n=1 Tax=Alkalihalobacillus sp. AL-G TaxID=2926399 RepID=UPI00272DA9B1|nr:thiamine diphosphokinase [Alkalihalobacillus sp. AL-G]WLD95110.1 thiamine diphosphokinase [Alkalihalobacillus sp. AL-G]
MQRIHIVAGGPEYLIPELHFQDEDIVVGVDEGVKFLANRNIAPNAAFGDFDSISSQEFSSIINDPNIRTYTFEQEKDMTDLELAVRWGLEQLPDMVVLYGVTGGRLDHELINIQMMSLGLEHDIAMKIIDTKNEIEIKNPGKYTVEIRSDLPYVSFVPFSQLVKGINLEGFRYPLYDADLVFGSTLCISNELVTKKGTYSFDDGILMMVRSKD